MVREEGINNPKGRFTLNNDETKLKTLQCDEQDVITFLFKNG